MKKSLLVIIAILVTVCALQLQPAFAAPTVTTPPVNPLQGQKIYLPGSDAPYADQGQYITSSFIPRATSTIIAFGGALALVFVIISGIQMLTAYENDERLGQAKKTLTWALVGFVISILSYAIVQIIVSVKFNQ